MTTEKLSPQQIKAERWIVWVYVWLFVSAFISLPMLACTRYRRLLSRRRKRSLH